MMMTMMMPTIANDDSFSLDDPLWEQLLEDGPAPFRGTFSDRARLDVATATTAVVVVPAQPTTQEVSPMDGEYADLARVGNAEQAAARDAASAAFSGDGVFFPGAASSSSPLSAPWSPSSVLNDFDNDDFMPLSPDYYADSGYEVDEPRRDATSRADVGPYFRSLEREPLFPRDALGDNPYGGLFDDDADAFLPDTSMQIVPALLVDASVGGADAAHDDADAGAGAGADGDDDDAGSPVPVEGGSKAFRPGVLPDNATRRASSIARDSIHAVAEHEQAPRGRRAPKRSISGAASPSPAPSPAPSSSSSSSSAYTPLSVRRRIHYKETVLSAPPSPGAESDTGDAMSDDDDDDDDSQQRRKVRTVTTDGDDNARAPIILGGEQVMIHVNPRELSAPPAPVVASSISLYGGRKKRHVPKPALLYGGPQPAPGEWPAPVMKKKNGGSWAFHDEQCDELGYEIRVRANAKDWGRNLLADSKVKVDKHHSLEAKQEHAWRRKLMNTFHQEIERIIEAWQVHYNMDEEDVPPIAVIARDITLMWRWLVDTYGETTTTGKAV